MMRKGEGKEEEEEEEEKGKEICKIKKHSVRRCGWLVEFLPLNPLARVRFPAGLRYGCVCVCVCARFLFCPVLSLLTTDSGRCDLEIFLGLWPTVPHPLKPSPTSI